MNPGQFLAELKNRRVYRAAVIYAAAAWALLQVADVSFPLIGLGEGAIKLVLALAAAGFPIAMVLAWMFDLTPQGVVEAPAPTAPAPAPSPARLAQFFLTLVLVLLVGLLYVERLTPQGGGLIETSAKTRKSIAVMPFVMMSDADTMDYLGEGLAEEILNLLARLNELNVAARTSSFYFSDRNVDARTIGEHLGVEHLLEGSVRVQGDRIRVTAQLIETEKGFHVWSKTYDRKFTDAFSLQDHIAVDVVDNLEVLLSRQSREVLNRTTVLDPVAYDYYLRGRDLLRRLPNESRLTSAVRMFEEAIDIQANYADGYAGLCDAWLLRYRLNGDTAAFSSAKRACNTALSLADNSAPVYVALGNLYRHSGEYARAEAAFELALEHPSHTAPALTGLGETYLAEGRHDDAAARFREATNSQPNYWPAHMGMGNLMLASGRAVEAIPFYERINELLPDSGFASNNLGGAYYLLGRFEDAVRTWKQALARSPSGALYTNLGSSLYFLRRFEEAVRMYREATTLAPDNFELWGNLADAQRFVDGQPASESYARALELAQERIAINAADAQTLALMGHYHANLGERESAVDVLERARALAPDDMYVYYFTATAHTALGDVEPALIALEKSLSLGYFDFLVGADAGLDDLRGQRRYQALMDDATRVDGE